MNINRKIGKWLALTLLLVPLPVVAQEPAEETAPAAEPQGFTFTIDPIVFGIMVIMLMVRPQGLFGRLGHG